MLFSRIRTQKYLPQFIIAFLLNIFAFNILFASPLADKKTQTPMVENGVIDLSNYSFTQNIELNGNWLFTSDFDSSKTTLNVPGDWESICHTPYSSGTYTATINFTNNLPQMLALQLPELDQYISVTINDALVFEPGEPDKNKQDSTLQIISFTPHTSNTISIHLRNDYFRHGGLVYPIRLGLHSNILKQHFYLVIIKSIMIGFLIFLSVFFIFLFLTKYPRGTSLYLTIAVFFFAIRFFSSDDLIYTFLSNNPILKYKINYISTYLACSFSIPFFYNSIIPKKWLNNIKKVLLYLGFVFAFITVFLPMRLVSFSVVVLSVYGFLSSCYIILASLPSLFRKEKKYYLIFMCGIIGSALTGYFLLYNEACNSYYINISDISIFVFMFLCTFLLALQISTTFKKVELLSSDLEKQVVSRTEQLNRTINKLELLSSTDGLTGIYNKRKFTELGEREISIHHRHKRPLSLIMIDIDRFKNINDTYGHKTGDEALKFLTSICRQEIRGTDILGRIGGDEFALLLLETTNEKAACVAEHLRHSIHEYSKINNNVPEFTISMGVITCRLGEILSEAVERADNYLYKAKNLSRNTVQTQKNFSEDDLELLDMADEK